MKFWYMLGEYFKKHWIRLLSFTLYGVVIIVFYNSMRQDYVSLINYSNACFIAGITLILFGCLAVVNYFGGFDIYSYMFLGKRVNGKKETLYDYSLRKKTQRKPQALYFLDYLYIGALYTIIAIIFGSVI